MSNWYPKATVHKGNDSGSYTGGPAKGVLHTTEGKSYAGALAAYKKNNSWPHFTVSFERGYFDCWQHVPVDRAARSLRNKSGGVQTNRDFAVQIEIVGTCNVNNKHWGDQYVENFPDAYLDGILELMIWVEHVCGVKPEITVTLKPYPDSYGNNGVRMSNSQWDNYNGWCGHQHVPENDHGDPGLIDINYLLQRLGSPSTLQEAKMRIPGAVQAVRVPGGVWNEFWVVANDGGVFSFNGAPFHGSVPGLGVTVSNVVAIAPHGRSGYWLLGSDGGVFAFGDAPFHGSYLSLDPVHRNTYRTFIGIEPNGDHYMIYADDGAVYNF